MSSIQTNFRSPQVLEMIEYPGLVINVDKMLQTLGGEMRVSQALSGEQKRLELRYHPDNPFNKPAYAEENASRVGLLLRVRVKRSKKNPLEKPQYRVSIVGHCIRAFEFQNSLCDYQYLPLCRVGGRFSYAMNSLVPSSVLDEEYFTRSNPPFLCMPFIFARADTTQTNSYRHSDITLKEDGQKPVLGVSQKVSYDTREVVQFNITDPLPTQPDPQILKRMKVKYVSDDQFKKVKMLFDECPIWTRIALLYESGASNDKLKCILPSLAYYFSNGPWRSTYVRYGYDPRKDFQSRKYQMFDFRLRFRSGIGFLVPQRRQVFEKKKLSQEVDHEIVQELDYPYLQHNKLPRSRQCMFRYCDLHLPKIQEMLDKIPTPVAGAICNERSGWLPPGFDTQVRQIVNNAMKELLRTYYRRKHMNAELAELEQEQGEDAEDEEYEDEGYTYDDEDNEDNEDEEEPESLLDQTDGSDFLTAAMEEVLDNV